VPRVLQLLDEHHQYELSKHHVSYWSTKLRAGSRIGIFPKLLCMSLFALLMSDLAALVVDPPINKVHLVRSLIKEVSDRLGGIQDDPPILFL
jgi:hypothetical protein